MYSEYTAEELADLAKSLELDIAGMIGVKRFRASVATARQLLAEIEAETARRLECNA